MTTPIGTGGADSRSSSPALPSLPNSRSVSPTLPGDDVDKGLHSAGEAVYASVNDLSVLRDGARVESEYYSTDGDQAWAGTEYASPVDAIPVPPGELPPPASPHDTEMDSPPKSVLLSRVFERPHRPSLQEDRITQAADPAARYAAMRASTRSTPGSESGRDNAYSQGYVSTYG